METVYNTLICAVALCCIVFMVSQCTAKQPRLVGECKLVARQGAI